MGFASISHTKMTDLETHLTELMFDVSAENGGAVYANLTEALAVVPNNI